MFAAFLLLLLVGHSLALGDEDPECGQSDYPPNIRVLLDSWRYQRLLGENDDGLWRARNIGRESEDTQTVREVEAYHTLLICIYSYNKYM